MPFHRVAFNHRGECSICLPFLQDFIAEQTEEEAMVGAIVDRLALADGQSGAIFILDHELGAR